MRTPTALPLAVLLALSPLAAQRTIVVDANSGSGSDFSDIPPAIAAATDGDTILVLPGIYSPSTIADKSVALLGLAGAVIDSQQPALAAIDVVSVASFHEVTVRGFRATGTYLLASFVVRGNQGRVLFEDLIGDRFFVSGGQLQMNRCVWSNSMSCFGAVLGMSSCAGRGDLGSGLGTAGLALTDCTATCADCSFSGLPGLLGFSAGPGISLTNSTLRLAGDGSNSIRAGQGGGFPDVPAVAGTGNLELDPDLRLYPLGNAPPIAGTLSVRIAHFASLTARAGGLRELVTIDLASGPGERYFLFWARAGEALPFPLLDGQLWLDPATIVLATSGTFDASGATRFQFRAPRLPGLIGAPFTWQAVTATPGAFRLSNPASYAHLP